MAFRAWWTSVIHPSQGPTLLGYMTFNLVGLGVSDIIFSDDNPDDLNEGFALEVPGEFRHRRVHRRFLRGYSRAIGARLAGTLGGLAILRRR